MVSKRDFREDGESGSGVPARIPNKRPAYSGRNVFGVSPDDIAKLEHFLRKPVREAVEQSFSKILGSGTSSRPGSSIDPIGPSQGAGYELRFVNNLPATLYTGSKIEAEDESPVMVELIDSGTSLRVSAGPQSSVKVLIVVLDGDFGSDKGEDWSEDEFNSNIVRAREGRKPLITGELTINLREGLGYLSNITFTDNSSWIRSRRFRLGARISQKVPIQSRVKEAASGSFVVKDHRGEAHRKRYPPQLKDDVWRLEKIAKDRPFHLRLAEQGINTVEGFLQLLETNPSLLRAIISPTIPNKTWEAIVAHAMTCVVDDSQLFGYSQESTGAGLLLNSVYRVVKVTFDGHNYLPVDELTPHQMTLMQHLKRQAYANLNQLVPVNGLLILGPPQPRTGQQPDAFLAPQDSTLYGSEGLGSQQWEASGPYEYEVDQIYGPTAADSFPTGDVWPEAFNGGISFPGSSEGPAMFNGQSAFPSAYVWTLGNGFSFGSSSDQAGEGLSFLSLPNFGLLTGSIKTASQSPGVHIPGAVANGRSRVAWCKVRAAFKFRSMKNVAARRRLSFLCAM